MGHRLHKAQMVAAGAILVDNADREKTLRAELEQMLTSYICGTNESGTFVAPYVREILRDARNEGYKVWRENFERDKLCTPFFLQKAIRGRKDEKLYFIEIAIWDLGREFPDYRNDKGGGVGLAPKVQFYVGDDENRRTVDVSAFLKKDDTLKDIERFFSDFYEKMGCSSYEKENG